MLNMTNLKVTPNHQNDVYGFKILEVNLPNLFWGYQKNKNMVGMP